MKKIFALVVLVVASVSLAVAQPRAIGARLGWGAELSYEHGFGESNMLSVDLGLPGWGAGYWGLNAAITYDWIDPFGAAIPWDEQGQWHWYMGVGGAAGLYGFNSPTGFAGVAGRIGIEYDFWFPMQLSLDWRPTIGAYFNGNGAGYHTPGLYGVSLGIRYLFGQNSNK